MRVFPVSNAETDSEIRRRRLDVDLHELIRLNWEEQINAVIMLFARNGCSSFNPIIPLTWFTGKLTAAHCPGFFF